MLYTANEGMLLHPDVLETPAPAIVAVIKKFAPIHEDLQTYLAKIAHAVTGRVAFPIVTRERITVPLHNVEVSQITDIQAAASQVHRLVDNLCSVHMQEEWHVPFVIRARSNEPSHQQEYNWRVLATVRFRTAQQTVHAFADGEGGIIIPVD